MKVIVHLLSKLNLGTSGPKCGSNMFEPKHKGSSSSPEGSEKSGNGGQPMTEEKSEKPADPQDSFNTQHYIFDQ